MATWYEIEYQDANGIALRVDIEKVGNTTLSPTRLQGFASLSYDSVDSPFEVMRPSSLTVSIEADLLNKYEDLYSEIEREWKVTLYRGEAIPFIIWQGWMLPDQIYEDYVNSTWLIEMTAECGLSSLQNKSYVDANGEIYTGQTDLRTIVKRCLERTGMVHNLEFMKRSSSVDNFPVEVGTGAGLQDFFDQKIDQKAFLTEDGKNADSCWDILEEILGLVNAYVFLNGTSWTINWSPQAGSPFTSGQYQYLRYIDGDLGSTPIDVSGNGLVTIGPERAGYNLHWINANQRIERRPSLGKVQSYYEYSTLSALNGNPNLDNDGATISDWTFVDRGGADALNSVGTVTVATGGTFQTVLTSDQTPNNIPAQNLVVAEVRFTAGTSSSGTTAFLNIGIEIDDTTETWYLWNRQGSIPLEWVNTTTVDGINSTYFSIGISGSLDSSFKYDIETPPVPIEGKAQIKIYPQSDVVGLGFQEVEWDFIGLSSIESTKPQGATHSAERIANPSSFVEDDLRFTIGDWDGAPYGGTLYLTDGTSLTENGYSNPIASISSGSIHRVCVRDRLFVRGYPARLFEGDVYGSGLIGQSFLDYNSVIEIAGFSGVRFQIVGYEWDTKLNIYSVKLWQMHWAETAGAPGFENEVLDDMQFDKITNFGNVVDATIKG